MARKQSLAPETVAQTDHEITISVPERAGQAAQIAHAAKVLFVKDTNIVTIRSDKDFDIRFDNHTIVHIAVGVQKVPRFVTEHFYFAANGAKIIG